MLLIASAIVVASGSGAPSAWAQDTVPPRTEIIAGPIGPTRDNQPTFTLESSEPNSTFTCTLDATAPVPCGPLFYQPSQPLPEGFHQIFAVATDPAGNTDPIGSGREFTVDRSITGARLDAPRRQRVAPRELRVNIELFGQEALEVRTLGLIRIGKRELPMRPLQRRLGDRVSIQPSLTATTGVERAVARALRDGDRVEVEVNARFRDEVRNEERRSRTIVLR